MVLNLIMNVFFIVKCLGKDNDDFFVNLYSLVLAYFFVIQATVFLIVGCFLCRKLYDYYYEYYIENGTKIKLAIAGLTIPLYFRGFYNITRYQFNLDVYKDVKSNNPILFYSIQNLVFSTLPTVF